MAFFYFNKVCSLVKYSHAFVERLSQGTSSLASQLTTVSLDMRILKEKQCKKQREAEENVNYKKEIEAKKELKEVERKAKERVKAALQKAKKGTS